MITGDEMFLSGAHVLDFWRQVLEDLRLNSRRGMLAHILVARAAGGTQPNDDCGNVDVLSPEGIEIEVRSSGYLHSWSQVNPSKIIFSGLMGRTWSSETGHGAVPEVRADVFVLAVHTRQDAEAYDPLDLDAWDFYILPGSKEREVGQTSMSLNRVRSLVGNPVYWDELRASILTNVPRRGGSAR